MLPGRLSQAPMDERGVSRALRVSPRAVRLALGLVCFVLVGSSSSSALRGSRTAVQGGRDWEGEQARAAPAADDLFAALGHFCERTRQLLHESLADSCAHMQVAIGHGARAQRGTLFRLGSNQSSCSCSSKKYVLELRAFALDLSTLLWSLPSPLSCGFGDMVIDERARSVFVSWQGYVVGQEDGVYVNIVEEVAQEDGRVLRTLAFPSSPLDVVRLQTSFVGDHRVHVVSSLRVMLLVPDPEDNSTFVVQTFFQPEYGLLVLVSVEGTRLCSANSSCEMWTVDDQAVSTSGAVLWTTSSLFYHGIPPQRCGTALCIIDNHYDNEQNCWGNRVIILDMASGSVVGRSSVSGCSAKFSSLQGAVAEDGSCYTLVQISDDKKLLRLTRFDLMDGTVAQSSWDLSGTLFPEIIGAAANGTLLFLTDGDDTWLLDTVRLRAAIVLRGSCPQRVLWSASAPTQLVLFLDEPFGTDSNQDFAVVVQSCAVPPAPNGDLMKAMFALGIVAMVFSGLYNLRSMVARCHEWGDKDDYKRLEDDTSCCLGCCAVADLFAWVALQTVILVLAVPALGHIDSFLSLFTESADLARHFESFADPDPNVAADLAVQMCLCVGLGSHSSPACPVGYCVGSGTQPMCADILAQLGNCTLSLQDWRCTGCSYKDGGCIAELEIGAGPPPAVAAAFAACRSRYFGIRTWLLTAMVISFTVGTGSRLAGLIMRHKGVSNRKWKWLNVVLELAALVVTVVALVEIVRLGSDGCTTDVSVVPQGAAPVYSLSTIPGCKVRPVLQQQESELRDAVSFAIAVLWGASALHGVASLPLCRSCHSMAHRMMVN